MIRIITDSTCEAPDEVLRHPAVTVAPLSVVFGQISLRDGVDITHEEFWARLPNSTSLPTTSQVTPADFIAVCERFCTAGDEVIILTISGKLSGTVGAALAARDSNPEWPISVVESKTTSVALGLLVQEAVSMVDAGAARDEIVARLTQMREEIPIVFVLESLEHLHRGGRIGKATALLGTLLKFVPLLAIVDGEIIPIARVRTRAKALEAAQQHLLASVPARGSQVRLALTQACAESEAKAVGDELAQRFGTSAPYVAPLGPVLGVHVGPGTIGICVHGGG